MDNRFAFGLWIFLDLGIIALGAGAFFSGFLLYILKWRDLKAVINSAVIVGFLCYSGAIVCLMIDVGQPLRAWFTFWHPNVHSMLTEVTFCISCYLLVLTLEYLPIVFEKQASEAERIVSWCFEWESHKLVPVQSPESAPCFRSFTRDRSADCTACCAAGPSPIARDSESGRPRSFSSFFRRLRWVRVFCCW